MDTIEIISRFYNPKSKAFHILVGHSMAVTEKALKIATQRSDLNPDLLFIEEAAMLHDIGIFMTNAPDIYCFGDYPYLAHGYLGCDLLNNLLLPDHALVCERHTGVGFTKEEILTRNLPLPPRDMIPESVEEQIIAFADKFYSKSREIEKEKSVKDVRKSMAKFGEANLKRFDEWCELFL